MKNWSTDTKQLKKNPNLYKRWETQQLINFGLDGAKLETGYLKKNFNKLEIDPHKKTYLSFILWGTTSSPQRKKNS